MLTKYTSVFSYKFNFHSQVTAVNSQATAINLQVTAIYSHVTTVNSQVTAVNSSITAVKNEERGFDVSPYSNIFSTVTSEWQHEFNVYKTSECVLLQSTHLHN